MADPDEALGQHVQEETAQKLYSVQGHALFLGVIPVVLDGEGDLAVGEIDDAVVRDGHPMGVGAQVAEDPLGAAERRLGVDHPVLAVQAVTQGRPIVGVGEVGGAAGQFELAVLVGLVESGKKLAA